MGKAPIGLSTTSLPNPDMPRSEKHSPNQNGGARAGAGRKKGGTNRITADAVEQTKATGITPLEYLLTVMRAPEADPRERMSAAIAAAPYVHAKLSTVDVKSEHSGQVLFGWLSE